MELTELNCKPIKKGMPALNDSEISYYKAMLHSDWRVIGIQKISRNYNFDNYKFTLYA
jgi:pterin-4a-carbinolamine dehydratase